MAKEKEEAAPAKRRLSKSEAKCRIEGCKRPYRAKGYCTVHYKVWRRGEMDGHRARYHTCGKEGCHKPMVKWGLCDEHWKAHKGGEAEAAPAA